MGTEHKAKNTEKAQPTEAAIETESVEIAALPGFGAAGKALTPLDLPPGLRRALQRVAGNGYVQRVLTGGVAQRQGPTTGGDSSAAIPVLPNLEARRALALDILKKAYGGLIKQESKVNGTANEDELRSRYDQAMVRMKRSFREQDGTKRPWKAGDSLKYSGTKGEFPGFHDPSTNQVYVDLSKKPDEQVATIVHELLHANAAEDFLSTLGRNIDEGMTERLTQKAFAKSGYSAPSGYFVGQVAMVGQLASMFGENTMMYAYFNGTAILRSMMNAALDESIFDRFAIETRANNQDWLSLFISRYQRALSGAEVDKKIAAINTLLDWWVSDADMANIANIWNGSSPDEQTHIRAAILSRITSLGDHGQRAQLRALVGS